MAAGPRYRGPGTAGLASGRPWAGSDPDHLAVLARIGPGAVVLQRFVGRPELVPVPVELVPGLAAGQPPGPFGRAEPLGLPAVHGEAVVGDRHAVHVLGHPPRDHPAAQVG